MEHLSTDIAAVRRVTGLVGSRVTTIARLRIPAIASTSVQNGQAPGGEAIPPRRRLVALPLLSLDSVSRLDFKEIRMMRVRESRGFTLIELLIVVAIIGIIAAI